MSASVRGVRIGGVDRELIGRAVAALDVVAADRDRHVGVDAVLVGVGLGVGLLIRLGRLVQLLVLTRAAATGGAVRRGVLGLFGLLLGRSLVRGLREGRVVELLRCRAGAALNVAAADRDRHVGVDAVLVGVGLGVGLLIGLSRLVEVLVLTRAATAGLAVGARRLFLAGRLVRVGLVRGRRRRGVDQRLIAELEPSLDPFELQSPTVTPSPEIETGTLALTPFWSAFASESAC